MAPLIAALIVRWQESESSVLIPTYEGKRGHPTFFSLETCQRDLRSARPTRD